MSNPDWESRRKRRLRIGRGIMIAIPVLIALALRACNMDWPTAIFFALVCTGLGLLRLRFWMGRWPWQQIR